jgi:hypothetical protein
MKVVRLRLGDEDPGGSAFQQFDRGIIVCDDAP